MHRFFRPHLAACGLAAVALVGLSPQAQAQQALEEWQQDELRPLVEAVGSALEGELVQADDPFPLVPDFLKGTEGNTYVPFTLTLEPSQVGQGSVLMYLLVAPHVEPDPETEVTADTVFDSATYEDAFFIDVSAARSEGGPIRIHRAFSAPGGTYDVWVVVRDSVGEDGDEDILENSMIMMLKEELEVPDFWNDQLQTSSVIVATMVEPLEAPLTQEEQIANPYTLGGTRIVPKTSDMFTKEEELSLIMLVYNPQLGDGGLPDVTIEYDFNHQTEAGEEFFNRTSPQQFNAQTLPPGFDMAAGHQIVAGQAVPLASFPSGDYRLAITVTDNASGQKLMRDVNFTVSE